VLVAVGLVSACLWSSACGVLYDVKVWTLGVNASLHCNDSAQYPSVPHDAVPVSWMLPNFTVLHGDRGRFKLLDSNWTLNIVDVSTSDLGEYRCLLCKEDVDVHFVLRIGLNAGGPYFHDLWQKYRSQTVAGLSASFGFLLIAVVVYVAYRLCSQPRDDHSNGPRTSGELADNSGTGVTVIGIVSRRSKVNWQTFASSSSTPHDVARPYPGNVDDGRTRACTTQL